MQKSCTLCKRDYELSLFKSKLGKECKTCNYCRNPELKMKIKEKEKEEKEKKQKLLYKSIKSSILDIIEGIKTSAENIYDILGTGFSEKIYHTAMEVEFRIKKYKYESLKVIPINYKGYNVGRSEADLIVHYDNDYQLIIELKACPYKPRPSEITQVKTYLNNIDKSTYGIIINFPQPNGNDAREKIDFCIVYKNKESNEKSDEDISSSEESDENSDSSSDED